MECARPNPSGRDRKTPHAEFTRRGGTRVLLGGLALTGAFVLAGCDSTVGIPGDDEPVAVSAVSKTPPAAIPATPVPFTTAAAAPSVGPVTELPASVRRWADDLKTATVAQLQAKCWTIAPRNVADMYADEQSILAALAQPGTATSDGITWKTRNTTVAVDRAALDTGYACPRVASAGADIDYNDADARHTVRRYLARFVGTPLDAADKEGTYPLICKATPATWDPTGTGKGIPAPLAVTPGKLTGATKFADQEISSERLRGDYIAVQVPVTNPAGTTQTRTFTLVAGAQGYCIGDVSA
ncbi:hypothetical protein DFR70_10697 [Nocardia tenerifensis]|uniref:Uncharacterized protein n=1 Tax=Nocardia tenerifensis TaxID=228006 RepID=A0A318K4B3_9NOCA|nr:hypothetical protein [Nocardia tenerifensis]PXX63043.1 hypothetical protein DFR70_10697 [Nocardia tenerifensis]